jgi:hypothetical protein
MKVVAIWHGRSWRSKGLQRKQTMLGGLATLSLEKGRQPQSALADERRTPRLQAGVVQMVMLFDIVSLVGFASRL